MKFSGKLWPITILKVTIKQGFTLSLENTFLKNHKGGGGQIDPPAFLGLIRKAPERPHIYIA